MIVERFPISVILERRPARSQWQDHLIKVAAVLPGATDTEPWSILSDREGVTHYFAGGLDIIAYGPDTKGYKDNIEAPRPAVYVVFRKGGGPVGWTPLLATVDPAEAQAHSENGDDFLEAVPLPQAVFAWLTAFVARHHVEKTQLRRKRQPADPESLAPRRSPDRRLS